jgi:hypothetical protein
MTRARRFALRILTATAVCSTAFAPVPAAAQEPATTFNALAGRVATGATLTVATDDGRKVTGRLVSLSDAVIVLDGGGGQTIQAQGVKTVAARGKRPVMKGFLIGLAAGAGLSILAVATAQCSSPEEGACDVAAPAEAGAVVLLTAIGAGVGAGVGAAMPRSTTVVYRAPAASGGAPIAFAPILSRGRAGLAVRMVF